MAQRARRRPAGSALRWGPMNASSSETIAANPLLTPSTLPYGLPDFGSIGDEHVIPAFRTAFVDHDAEIAAIVDNPEAPTFANTLEALEKSGRLLDRVAAYFFNVAGTDKPSPAFTNKVREEALSRGLILLTCGVYGNVIRFLPPLTVQDEVFDEALDILEASVRAARGPGAHQASKDGDLAPGQQEA